MPNIVELSVVVTVYNKGAFLSQTLNSIIQGVFIPQEIIIVDDFSSDDSVEVINRFIYECSCCNEISVKFIKNSSNRGVSHARNEGIRLSGHKYVLFLDGDDRFHSDFFRSLVDSDVLNLNPSVIFFDVLSRGLPYPGIERMSPFVSRFYDKSLNGVVYPFHVYDCVGMLSRFFPIKGCSFVVNKTFIGDVIFNECERNYEDFLFLYELLMNSESNNFAYLPIYSIEYHEQDAYSLSKKKITNIDSIAVPLIIGKALENNHFGIFQHVLSIWFCNVAIRVLDTAGLWRFFLRHFKLLSKGVNLSSYYVFAIVSLLLPRCIVEQLLKILQKQ